MSRTAAEHVLDGCITRSMSSYLKALGLLRILSKKDPEVTGRWNSDTFVIKTEMGRDEILGFLLEEYEPTPIIIPWSYNKYRKSCNKIKGMTSDRFKSYHDTIWQIDQILEQICGSNITKEAVAAKKFILLQMLRNKLPDNVVPWLDAVFVLERKKDKPTFAPILGSGGNDGNFDMAENFVERIVMLLSKDRVDESRAWLEESLFDEIGELWASKTTGHNPDGCGGPNSGMGFEGKSLSNPWDYVLMMEGTMLFAGSVSKRLSATSTGKAVSPFTADASNVGYATASSEDVGEGSEPPSKGEIWTPVWDHFATYREIKQVFSEGRVQLGGKPAKTGVEFARAVITMGVERGISRFQRFGILKRKGKAYLFINMGKIQVKNEPMANLLDELDEWYDLIIKKSKEKKKAPASLQLRVRSLNNAIMTFCTSVTKESLLRVLIEVGKLESHISGYDDYKPLPKLSNRWLTECYDNSAEFRLAAAVGSINDKDVGSIRHNLESVIKEKGYWKCKKDSVSFVWKQGDDTLRNMRRVLQRRGLDGKIRSLPHIPISGTVHARIGDVNEFLNGGLDTKKIGDLILPLSMIDTTSQTAYPWRNQLDHAGEILMPEAYVVIKMVYPPHAIATSVSS